VQTCRRGRCRGDPGAPLSSAAMAVFGDGLAASRRWAPTARATSRAARSPVPSCLLKLTLCRAGKARSALLSPPIDRSRIGGRTGSEVEHLSGGHDSAWRRTAAPRVVCPPRPAGGDRRRAVRRRQYVPYGGSPDQPSSGTGEGPADGGRRPCGRPEPGQGAPVGPVGTESRRRPAGRRGPSSSPAGRAARSAEDGRQGWKHTRAPPGR